ncbi:helix-turn-helix domain-containing protein [Gryllotalpicola reticulitermitis]|uniref:Helix-turn-helix domain-containing protein n=1 Tax=Gryllotalpicola reticulitermitis TaxID=1184153 RepID=A0ABV8Q623_9MICO
MAEDDAWNQPALLVSDPEMLRAFAHPLRQRIIVELSVRNHARAADLAKWLGEPANSVSFHLRVLAKAGLIREVPEKARDKRDRVWEAVTHGGLFIEDLSADPGIAGFVAARLDWLRRLAAGEFDADDSMHSAAHFGGALLTKDEAVQFEAELDEVQSKWRRIGAANAEREPDNGDRIAYSTVVALGPVTPPR